MGLGRDHLVSTEANRLAIEGVELDGRTGESLEKTDSVVVDKVVTITGHSFALCLLKLDHEVTDLSHVSLVALTVESQNSPVSHARLDEYVACHARDVLIVESGFVLRQSRLVGGVLAGELDALGRAKEELFKRALNLEQKVWLFECIIRYVIPVQIALNFLDHGNLVPPRIKRNVVWVISAEEAFKDLHRVAIEGVSLVCPVYNRK